MKKFLTVFFVSLGVIFFVLIIAGAVFFVTDPYNLKPALKMLTGSGTPTTETTSEGDKNPLLSDEQEAALESIGVDPASLPSEITPETEECLKEALGAERAAEIEAGAEPTANDYFKGRECF